MPTLHLSKTFYFLLAWLFFLLGLLGAMLPVLPTTPFMLLALWSFSRSSRRFHDWLYGHRLFGPPLRQWQRHRVIPLPAKWLATLTMSASLLYLFLYSSAPVILKWAALAFMAYGAFFIWTKPSRAKMADTPEKH
jgi:uncharacterized membrane protein YbaN (DUF454 family)